MCLARARARRLACQIIVFHARAERWATAAGVASDGLAAARAEHQRLQAELPRAIRWLGREDRLRARLEELVLAWRQASDAAPRSFERARACDVFALRVSALAREIANE